LRVLLPEGSKTMNVLLNQSKIAFKEARIENSNYAIVEFKNTGVSKVVVQIN